VEQVVAVVQTKAVAVAQERLGIMSKKQVIQ
jgi:hypothetical protein